MIGTVGAAAVTIELISSRNSCPVVVICGPTASGKTALAISLAERIDGEIISADSMQVYRGMDIGTAKPSANEQTKARFHLIDVVSPDVQFTASEWKLQAQAAINSIRGRGRTPVLCGGTGMYMRALLRNWSMAETPRDPVVRTELEAEAAQLGSEILHRRLIEVDPETANRLHPNDTLRIVRALEVCIVAKRPLSEMHRVDKQNSNLQSCTAMQFALTMPREVLYSRIDERVDDMMRKGLVEEVRRLMSAGYDRTLPALNSLGYKEICSFLLDGIELEDAIHQIKLNTRRYAKRQLTWFRAEPEITWVDTSIVHSAEAVRVITEAIADRRELQQPN